MEIELDKIAQDIAGKDAEKVDKQTFEQTPEIFHNFMSAKM